MKIQLPAPWVWIYYQKAWGLWQNVALLSWGISITFISHQSWPTGSVQQPQRDREWLVCACIFPFLLVTIIIVLSGLVTMQRVQGQSISRIHTHRATSLSLVSVLCVCRRCKKTKTKKKSCRCHLVWIRTYNPSGAFSQVCAAAFLCAVESSSRDLTITGSPKGGEQPTSSPTKKSEQSWLKCAGHQNMVFCLLLCIKSNGCRF